MSDRPPLWRSVPGYEGIYEVSSSGDVKSIARLIPRSRNGAKAVPELIKKPVITRCGYLRVRLWKNGESKDWAVHRLVALAFIGPAPWGHEVCHANGVKTDNCIENLRWCTKEENCSDRKLHGTCTSGERNGRAKLSREQVLEIRSSPLSHAKLSAKFGVSRAAIFYAKSGTTWKEE